MQYFLRNFFNSLKIVRMFIPWRTAHLDETKMTRSSPFTNGHIKPVFGYMETAVRPRIRKGRKIRPNHQSSVLHSHRSRSPTCSCLERNQMQDVSGQYLNYHWMRRRRASKFSFWASGTWPAFRGNFVDSGDTSWTKENSFKAFDTVWDVVFHVSEFGDPCVEIFSLSAALS